MNSTEKFDLATAINLFKGLLKSKTSKLSTKEAAVINDFIGVKKESQKSKAARYILLPANQIQSTPGSGNPEVADFLHTLSVNVANKKGLKLANRTMDAPQNNIGVNVIDSIHENGAKLITIDEDKMADFRFSYPGLRIIPEKFYRLAFQFEAKRSNIKKASASLAASFSTKITIADSQGKGIKGVNVVAFTDFATRAGAGGVTDASGNVSLSLSSNKIDRMYVYPKHSFWGFFDKAFVIPANFSIKLKPIDLSFDDSLRSFYPTRNWAPVTGNVRVGIIDTGFGPHKDVTIVKGKNMVTNENPALYEDLEDHGTHVAGIIAAHGALPGVAKGVELYIYRVFPKGGFASNYDIMKAIDEAKNDGCDFVNMSLGGADLDEGVVSSIKDAYSQGMICFAANGNEDRSPVAFPAFYSLCIAVSAMGRKGCFPPKTVQTGIVKAPFGTDKLNFIADFSNIGPETDLTAPGVGIISTVPGDNYAVLDGTSMACPAAAGMAARLLSTQPALLQLPRNQARADAIQKFLATKIKTLGFGANFEGKGMLTL